MSNYSHSLDYPYTCPDLDSKIKDAKDIIDSYERAKNVSNNTKYFIKPYPPCSRLVNSRGWELDYSKNLNKNISLYNKNLRRFYD